MPINGKSISRLNKPMQKIQKKKKQLLLKKKKFEKKIYASFGNNIKIIIYYKMKIIERAIA